MPFNMSYISIKSDNCIKSYNIKCGTKSAKKIKKKLRSGPDGDFSEQARVSNLVSTPIAIIQKRSLRSLVSILYFKIFRSGWPREKKLHCIVLTVAISYFEKINSSPNNCDTVNAACTK